MPKPSIRKVISVNGTYADVIPTWGGDARTVSVTSLKRGELFQACSIKFPNSGKWTQLTNDEMLACLSEGRILDHLVEKLGSGSNWRIDPMTPAQAGYLRRKGLADYARYPMQVRNDRYERVTVEAWPKNKGEASLLIAMLKGDKVKATPTPIPTPNQDEFGMEKVEDDPRPIEFPITDDDADAIEKVTTHSHDHLANKVETEYAVEELAGRINDIETSVNDLIEVTKTLRPIVIKVELPNLPEIEVTDLAHEMFPLILKRVARRRNLYLCGPAGTGKSFIAEQVARTLSLQFGAISVSGGTTKSDIFGYMNAAGEYVTTMFRVCYETGGVFCIDEIDSGNPNVLTGINQALAGSQCAFADGMVKKHADFVCVATANTFGTGPTKEFIGRNPIDKATLNRFTKLVIGVDERIETMMVEKWIEGETASSWLNIVRTARGNAEKFGIHAVVSPRDAENGAVAILDGSTMKESAHETFLFGETPENIERMVGGLL